jgi:hypothetical protein
MFAHHRGYDFDAAELYPSRLYMVKLSAKLSPQLFSDGKTSPH